MIDPCATLQSQLVQSQKVIAELETQLQFRDTTIVPM